jgi:hypothetical protein
MKYHGVFIGYLENEEQTHATHTRRLHLTQLRTTLIGISQLEYTAETVFQILLQVLRLWNRRDAHLRLPPLFQDPYILNVRQEIENMPQPGYRASIRRETVNNNDTVTLEVRFSQVTIVMEFEISIQRISDDTDTGYPRYIKVLRLLRICTLPHFDVPV